jgi:hypothetical protein
MALVVGASELRFNNAPWVNREPISFNILPNRYVYDDQTRLIHLFHVIDKGQVFHNFLVEASGPIPTSVEIREVLKKISSFLANFGSGAVVSGFVDKNSFLGSALTSAGGAVFERFLWSLVDDLTRSDLYYVDYDNGIATINCGLTA